MGPQTTGQIREGPGGRNRPKTFVRKKRMNRCGAIYVVIDEPKAISSTEQNSMNPSENHKNKSEPVASTEESEVAKFLSNFLIVDLKDYDPAQKTILSIQVNHVIGKPKLKTPKPLENLEKAEFIFMIDLNILILKT